MLTELNPEKVRFLVAKIREFDVQVEENLGGGSDAADDGFVAVFNDEPDSSVRHEVEEFVAAMDVDERRELVALSFVGHGDYAKAEWNEALIAAGSRPGQSTAAFLLENPTITDDLEEGLSLFGFSAGDGEGDDEVDQTSA
jgi:hypothetical protein